VERNVFQLPCDKKITQQIINQFMFLRNLSDFILLFGLGLIGWHIHHYNTFNISIIHLCQLLIINILIPIVFLLLMQH